MTEKVRGKRSDPGVAEGEERTKDGQRVGKSPHPHHAGARVVGSGTWSVWRY